MTQLAEVARAAGLVYEPDDIDRTFDAPVYQFCAFLDQDREHIITDAIPDVATTRWTHLFCDIMPADGGKIHGVRAAFERYGISPQEAIAFGDGENDLLYVRGRRYRSCHGKRLGHGEGARGLRYNLGGR